MTVPAKPHSMRPPRGGSDIGVTRRMPAPSSSTRAPITSRAAANRRVSRASRAPRITEGESATAARYRARAVIDFEPGTSTVASTGEAARGAGQGALTKRCRSDAP